MKTRSMRPNGARFEVPLHVSRNFQGFVADSSRSYAKWIGYGFKLNDKLGLGWEEENRDAQEVTRMLAAGQSRSHRRNGKVMDVGSGY